jgi:hypothetical protein
MGQERRRRLTAPRSSGSQSFAQFDHRPHAEFNDVSCIRIARACEAIMSSFRFWRPYSRPC